jgi:hypothetical protein
LTLAGLPGAAGNRLIANRILNDAVSGDVG